MCSYAFPVPTPLICNTLPGMTCISDTASKIIVQHILIIFNLVTNIFFLYLDFCILTIVTLLLSLDFGNSCYLILVGKLTLVY